MEYKIIKCEKCDTFQMSQAVKVFKCVNCKSSFQIKNIKILFVSSDPVLTTKTLQKIKKEHFLKNHSNSDFFSYQ